MDRHSPGIPRGGVTKNKITQVARAIACAHPSPCPAQRRQAISGTGRGGRTSPRDSIKAKGDNKATCDNPAQIAYKSVTAAAQ